MKKKLLLIIAPLLTSSAMASMSSTTYIDQTLIKCARNASCEIFSKHDWSISNDTPIDQNISVCYTTTVCPEYPANTKVFTECEQVSLGSMATKAGSKLQDYRSSYPWQGGCKVIASTQMTGWITQSSNREGRLYLQ